MPDEPEKIIQSCIKVVSSRDALVNSSLPETAAKALNQNYHSATGNIDINLSSRKKKPIQMYGIRLLDEDIFKSRYFRRCNFIRAEKGGNVCHYGGRKRQKIHNRSIQHHIP